MVILMTILTKALLFAVDKHKNQLDDQGLPYIAHLEQVARILTDVTIDPEIIAAGILHDTLEDTETTYDELVTEFGTRIADLVNEVTHEGTNDNHGYYFPRLHSHDAILIKFADRLSNLSRIDHWPLKRRQQYLKKSKFWNDA